MFLRYIIIHFLLMNMSSILYHRFHLECIVTDGEDVTNFLLFGKTVENFFGSSAHHYVYDKKFMDPSVIPPAMPTKLNKSMIFKLWFGAFRSTTNRCEIIITNIFDDTINKSIHPLETPTTEAKSSTTSKTSTPLSSMKQVLIPPSTPQNTVTQLRIAPDSLETPPQNISPNKKTSINCEARRALDFEATTQQLRQVYISPYFLYTFFCPWHMLNYMFLNLWFFCHASLQLLLL